MQTLGDWITMLMLAGGIFGLSRLAYKRYLPTIRSASLKLYHAIDHYVALWQESQFQQKRGLPDTYQLEPPSEPPRTSGSVPVPNRENLIRIAALVVSEDGSYTYSANKIAEFVGGTRTETLAAIRAVRGQPEPVAVDDMQLVKTGPRENYVRTGVKPLR